MSSATKFIVLKFTEGSEPERNPHKVVPSVWIKAANENDVIVPYPPEEQLPQPPLAECEDRHAIVERQVF